ncbi:RecQ family ATP-dependent DNA helicase [Gracilibacillus phocaeensis]|uniref:RecQ family ATP-dependent DNA helicase n=1 Tax=Gracilibacillus phocaeensis TaxID=2042304 RepID=UPI001030424E|nr:RecQ family ATP-dependent DNA helicase [Gracilibacillus phocaeensis]
MSNNKLAHYLHNYFGYSDFRKGQQEIIEAVLARQHVFAVLPTGTGKSICYQLPAMLLDGLVVVISPLLSLMTDQVKQLKAQGIKRVAALNSMMTLQERNHCLANLQAYQLIYISPEMLQSERVRRRLQQITIDLFVIDEAHCISQWGHEFRPDYLRLKQVMQQLGSPTVLALTATATPDVQVDIKKALDLANLREFVYPMDKPNIAFTVEHMEAIQDKEIWLRQLVSTYHVPTLIYFSSRKEAARIAMLLQEQAPKRQIAFYHGGLSHSDRLLIQQQFMQEQLDVICCTNAFGMGINKKNIQLVIHYHAPSQIESFIQEVGRSGRDGQESVSLVLYHESDQIIPRRLIESELPSIDWLQSALHGIYQKGYTYDQAKEACMLMADGQETYWRFFVFQLERLGVLVDYHFVLEKVTEEQVFLELEQLVEQRYQYKINKLNEMVNWLYTSSCKRKKLFQPFQPAFQTPDYMCCDACDFEWRKWQPTEQKRVEKTLGWQETLKQILYQGVSNEK